MKAGLKERPLGTTKVGPQEIILVKKFKESFISLPVFHTVLTRSL